MCLLWFLPSSFCAFRPSVVAFPRKRAHYIDPTVVSYEVTSDDSKYFTQPWPESAKKMIDAALANVSNRMRKNQTADRHCSIKYVVARLLPRSGRREA